MLPSDCIRGCMGYSVVFEERRRQTAQNEKVIDRGEMNLGVNRVIVVMGQAIGGLNFDVARLLGQSMQY